MTDPITDAELNMSAEEWMQALAEDPSCIKTYLEAARVRGYRAGLEAAAGVAKAYGEIELPGEDASTVRFVAASRQDALISAILALPVPGEAPAIRTVPMMPVDPEADARIEELRAKQPPETVRKIAAPPAEAPDLRGLGQRLRLLAHKLHYEVHEALLVEAMRVEDAAAQPEGQAAPPACQCRDADGGWISGHFVGCPAAAAAPGGKDAAGEMYRIVAEAMKEWPGSYDGLNAVLQKLRARLAARAGGSRG